MSFTGTILTIAGGCGAPFVGPLGSALTIGSNVLNPDDGFDEVFQELETIQNLVEEGVIKIPDVGSRGFSWVPVDFDRYI